MTNILGNNKIIVDADALIGLIKDDDYLHIRCLKISQYLTANEFIVFIPYPIVLEAATALSRKKWVHRPDLAAKLLRDYAEIGDESFITDVTGIVAEIYNPETSLKNTPFDHYVLALAKVNNIPYVFSFDVFYKKKGLKLIEEIMR